MPGVAPKTSRGGKLQTSRRRTTFATAGDSGRSPLIAARRTPMSLSASRNARSGPRYIHDGEGVMNVNLRRTGVFSANTTHTDHGVTSVLDGKGLRPSGNRWCCEWYISCCSTTRTASSRVVLDGQPDRRCRYASVRSSFVMADGVCDDGAAPKIGRTGRHLIICAFASAVKTGCGFTVRRSRGSGARRTARRERPRRSAVRRESRPRV